MSSHLKADLLLVSVTLIAALGWMFSKESLAGFPPLLFLGIRFVIAGAILFGFGARQVLQMSRAEVIRASLVGLIFCVAMIFWALGLAYGTHIGVGAFLNCLGVVLVPVVALCFGERVSRSTWVALPLAALGLGLLSLDEHYAMGWGELSYLCAAVAFAFYFTLNSRAASQIPAVALAAVQLMVVGVVTTVLSALIETWDFGQPASIWFWLLASTLIGTALRFFVQTWGQGLAPASHAAIIMTLEPIWAALLAMLWFSESMSWIQALGCAVIFSALLVSRSKALISWCVGWAKEK